VSFAKIKDRVQYRVESGWDRVQTAAAPVAQAAVAASIAFLIGRYLIGHQTPFFAAFAAWACLGFSFKREVRKVAEVGIAVIIGVTVGDIVGQTIGSGWWQVAVALFGAALFARFIDHGIQLTSTAGAQAIIITGIPNLTGGPYGRAIDAIIGASVACLMAVLLPADPRKQLRAALGKAAKSLADTVELLGTAARTGDYELAEAALDKARKADATVSAAVENTQTALHQAQLTLNRRHEAELANFVHQARLVDQALQAVQILARRAAHDLAYADPSGRGQLADVLAEFAGGVRELSSAMAANEDTAAARVRLQHAANQLDPDIAAGDLPVQAQLILMRSAVVDTLQATGLSNLAASAPLPEFKLA